MRSNKHTVPSLQTKAQSILA